ncbi:DegT/DnrJ/EryC1/StrS family aminotransferase [Peribacillus frigoritolerans]|uniref:DegT/DnrJ/EryC1/StrS family aminotransferase n=1 Tax=Peribacillus frigoritolerans TaxID=450367 RepID=UPI00207947A4|nr:DegT/DnrJ/EryC1/StrS family aminotransferase [Peribacillus frigoritolerans]USK78064.1 DegT/DnrJ/EryC1/StrS family aminotransferase [Peribacillus frigoritolerans]WJE45392.1 DegT/DnrJ/EryC1/StrS family aminotransferase [Peribacillus frigoritolerans]
MINRPRIPLVNPQFNGNEKKYVLDCIDSTWISSNGKYINEFEKKFAEFCGTKYGITCANGTVALHLALLAHNVGPGDEVIVPTLTYIATANAVTYCGGRPVFVDSEPQTWNIDPNRIEEKITKKTKGIIVVHLYGHPVDMDPIMVLAKKYSLFVIEDAAEAHGAKYKNQTSGSIGDTGCFSFFGNKLMTTGEGGMITTNDNELNQKMRLLRGQGMDPNKRYWFPIVGYNYRMTNVQAAIGLGQLEKITFHLKKRREIVRLYNKHFQNHLDLIEVPIEKSWAQHSFWMFSILLKADVKVTRDSLIELLEHDGIETRPLFYPMHVLPPYKETSSSFPIAEDIAMRGLNLPTHSMLTEENIRYIVERVAYHCKM